MESNLERVNIGLEIGGTNIKAIIVNGNLSMNNIIEEITNNKIMIKEFKTAKNPEQTIKEISVWVFEDNKVKKDMIAKVGVSMFGPLNLNKNSEEYGTVLNTPKPGWAMFKVVESIAYNLGIDKAQVVIELDVNCAAHLEHKLGNHGVNSLAYITIGTGVGVGVVAEGTLIHGLQHPEGGHIRVKRHLEDDFPGNCPIHGDCLEGLVTNGALKTRKALTTVDECADIPDNDGVWDIIGYYIAQVCLNLLYLLSTQKIIIGGGIINRELLLDSIRKHFINLNQNYIDNPLLKEDKIHNYIDRTGFKNYSGILSALVLLN